MELIGYRKFSEQSSKLNDEFEMQDFLYFAFEPEQKNHLYYFENTMSQQKISLILRASQLWSTEQRNGMDPLFGEARFTGIIIRIQV